MKKDIGILAEQLKQKPTRQLLSELNNLRINTYHVSSTDLQGVDLQSSLVSDYLGYDYSEMRECYRTELATREHVPNKPEAEKSRRAAAMAHHGSKKRKLKY